MNEIMAENKEVLYIPNEVTGEIIIDGLKARNLVQSMTWLPIADLEWTAERISGALEKLTGLYPRCTS
jgi:hypothetical protein